MTQTQVKNASDSNAANEQASGLSVRRRKLLGGVAASPLLLTVASRPVWAQGGMCTPSALASANLSGQHDFIGCGISAGWWKVKKDRWPIPYNTAFHSIFPKIRFNNVVIHELNNSGGLTTLGDVIDTNFPSNKSGKKSNKGSGQTPSQDPGNLAFHLIGAYLNALAFPSGGGAPGYAYTPQQIVDAYRVLDNGSEDAFTTLKDTLELANDAYDASTAKP